MSKDTLYKRLWWGFLIFCWAFWGFNQIVEAQEVIPSEECLAWYSAEYCQMEAESISVHGEHWQPSWKQELVDNEVGGYEIGTQIPTGHGDSYEFTPAIAETVRAAFSPENQRWGAALVGCESRGNWTAISRTHDYGLFQINRIWLRGVIDPFSADTQIAKVKEVFGYQGRGAWVCNGVAAGVSGS